MSSDTMLHLTVLTLIVVALSTLLYLPVQYSECRGVWEGLASLCGSECMPIIPYTYTGLHKIYCVCIMSVKVLHKLAVDIF